MSNGDGDPLIERAKFFRDHVQTILSLATGSFVLSITFLHDIAPAAKHTDFLRRSWGLFVLTILLGLIYNYVLSIYVSVSAKKYGILLSIISFLFHLAFIVAAYYLFRFGVANI